MFYGFRIGLRLKHIGMQPNTSEFTGFCKIIEMKCIEISNIYVRSLTTCANTTEIDFILHGASVSDSQTSRTNSRTTKVRKEDR